MLNVKRRYLLSILTIMFLLTLSFAGAQDATMVGIEKGDIWEFKVVENTVTDEYGDIEVFEISTAEGGEVAVGETFEFEVTGDVSSTGIFDYTLDNGEVTATGTGDLGDFGSEAIFIDWDHWNTSAEGIYLFDDTDVTITDTTDTFTAVSVFESNFFYFFSLTITYSYFKDTGILKSMSIVYIIDTDTEKLIVENQTGSAAEAPGFSFFLALLALVAVPIISKKRRS